MRPIYRGDWPLTAGRGQRKVLTDYAKAIPVLKERTGPYCHLCEMRLSNTAAVEHIRPKEHHPQLTGNWYNFLLICHSCNSRKGATDPDMNYWQQYYWPHLNNTLLSFDYQVKNGGLPKPRSVLNPAQTAKALRLINLYKLNQTVKRDGAIDPRHTERLQALKMAIDRFMEYKKQPAHVTVAAIVDTACATGFFSLWLAIFQGEPPVKAALLDSPYFHLAGQQPVCFDQHYNLLNRNPQNASDPI